MIRISIIIPAYNRAKIIPATLDSILAQTYQNWECIVVDDLSKDDTKTVVQQYVEKDNRFHLFTNERKKGAQGARNTGILHASSEWVILFDSDNTMHPDMLEKLSAAITDDVDVVQCFSTLVDFHTGKQYGFFDWESEGNIHEALFKKMTYVDFNQALMRKHLIEKIGMLDEDCPSMQEWDTHIRLSKIAHYKTVKEPLLDYYLGVTGAISMDKRREIVGRMYILKKHLREWRSFAWSGECEFIWEIFRLIRRNKNIRKRLGFIMHMICIEPLSMVYLPVVAINKICKK